MFAPRYAYCERDVGAEADTDELEYISALHQTCFPTLRTDCSISSEDVRHYLRSKYGIVLSPERAMEIVDGLGGILLKSEREEEQRKQEELLKEQNKKLEEMKQKRKSNGIKENINNNLEELEENEEDNEDSDEEEVVQSFLDLIQIVSILFIPTFLRAETDLMEDDVDSDEAEYLKTNPNHDTYINNEVQPHYPPDVFQDVIHLLVSNVEMMEKNNSNTKDTSADGESDSQLLKSMTKENPIVTEKFVRALLLSFSQTRAASDKELVSEMVKVAGGEGSVFNEANLIKALTYDVLEWKWAIKNDDSGKRAVCSSFYDVFGVELRRIDSTLTACTREGRTNYMENMVASFDDLEVGVDEEGNIIENVDKLKLPRLKRQGRSVDYVMDSFGSVAFTVLIFIFFIFFSVSVVLVMKAHLQRNGYCAAKGGASFSCVFLDQLVSFILLGLTLVVSGITLIYPLSIGATTSTALLEGKLVALAVLLLTMLYCIVPYELYKNYEIPGTNPSDPNYDSKKILNSFYFDEALVTSFTVGVILCILFFMKILPMNLLQNQIGFLSKYFVPKDIRRTANMKLSAIYKLHNFLQNAQMMHFVKLPTTNEDMRSCKSSKDNDNKASQTFMKFQINDVMSNYLMNGRQPQRLSTMKWDWYNLGWSVDVIRKEGIWIHSRLIIGQVTQVVMGIFLIRTWFWTHEYYIDEIDKTLAQKDQLTPEQLYQVPQKWMITTSFAFGLTVALYVGIYIISAYVPSTVNTILLLRCGKIPSLKDPYFFLYRQASETIYQNIGNMIFSFLGCISVFFFGFTYLVFMCFYPPYQPVMATVAAAFCAIIITIVIRVILMVLTKKFYLSFYRREPLKANLSSLCMEAWNIGLGAYTIIKRLFISFIAAAFWIGRVDITFLSENVNYKGFGFDTAPAEYRKELLVHEAHHHPYLERLGAMYMMRLKFGDNFGNEAGIWWRNLFVIALMPWLSKYRKTLKESQQEKRLMRYYQWVSNDGKEDEGSPKQKIKRRFLNKKKSSKSSKSTRDFALAAKKAMYLYKINTSRSELHGDVVMDTSKNEVEAVLLSDFTEDADDSYFVNSSIHSLRKKKSSIRNRYSLRDSESFADELDHVASF